MYSTSAGGVGAVYTMSNAPTMTQVLIHSINGNGQLTMVSAINTNETGVSTTSSDPLFFQGALMVYSNSLSMFTISPSDATQLTLISV